MGMSQKVITGSKADDLFYAYVPEDLLDPAYPHRAVHLARKAVADRYSGETSRPRYEYVAYFRKSLKECESDRPGYRLFRESA